MFNENWRHSCFLVGFTQERKHFHSQYNGFSLTKQWLNKHILAKKYKLFRFTFIIKIQVETFISDIGPVNQRIPKGKEECWIRHGKWWPLQTSSSSKRVYYCCYKVWTSFWWEECGSLFNLVMWSLVLSMQTSLQDWGHNSRVFFSHLEREKKSHFIGALELLRMLMYLQKWDMDQRSFTSNTAEIYTFLPSALSFLNNPAHINSSLAWSYWCHWQNSLFKEVHFRSNPLRISQRFKAPASCPNMTCKQRASCMPAFHSVAPLIMSTPGSCETTAVREISVKESCNAGKGSVFLSPD